MLERTVRKCGMLAVVSFLLGVTSEGLAADKHWSAKEKGNWSSSNNWSPAGVPTKDDDVVFNETSNTDCQIDMPVEVRSITLNSEKYTGTVYQKAAVKVKTGFYLKGLDGAGCWKPGGNLIESAGDWISEIKLRFQVNNSTVRLTGSGILKGYYFDRLECAFAGKTIELQSFTWITGKMILGSGTLTGKSCVTFYREGEVLTFSEEKPPNLRLFYGFRFRPAEEWETLIPGADYYSTLKVTGTTTDTFLTLEGDIKCENLIISFMKKEKTTTLSTKNHNIEVSGNLTIGEGKDKYGALKCGKSNIKVDGNLVIVNENSSVWAEDSTWEIGGEIINKGSLIKGNAKIEVKDGGGEK